MLVILLLLGFSGNLFSQTTQNIRFVNSRNGSYSNDGRSWEHPKNNLQDAINELRYYLQSHPTETAYIFVAGQSAEGQYGRYVPTESTERSGGGMLSTSFKIYAGIQIYGGFNPDDPEAGFDASNPAAYAEKRVMKNGKTWAENLAMIEQNVVRGDEVSAMWDFKYPTILSGNHSNVEATFSFDHTRGRYNTAFPASSYHVVWFATNDTINDSYHAAALQIQYHYKGLTRQAVLDGVTIREGNAAQKTTSWHDHTAYGGGAYMVDNSLLRNCVIERCVATVRGGGVYMDGGGEMEHCYVHTCQSPGVGIVQGYGGGVCIDYDGSVRNCYIMQSSARIGAGVAICHVPGEYPWEARAMAEKGKKKEQISSEDEISPYFPYVTATIITNNTSTAEGGGVYLDEGGTLNHVTIVNNRCIGPDVTYYNRRHGRSGGVYVRTCGMIYNSVAWGNVTDYNAGIQFASVKQYTSNDQPHDISVYHSAFMNHDATDWSGVQKEVVISVEKDNMTIAGTTGNYVCFYDPTTEAGIIADADGTIHPDLYPKARVWHPRASSALALHGVQVTDAVQGASAYIQHAHTRIDLLGNTFEPVSSVGALVRYHETIKYAMVAPQGAEGEKESTPIPTLFVDPNRRLSGDDALKEEVGMSWDLPLGNIADATNYFSQYLDESDPNSISYKNLPEYDSDYKETGSTRDAQYVQILVKEGLTTTAGPGNYLGQEMRTASVRVKSHMRLYAAYPGTNKGTDTSGRNPRTYITRITANIMGSQDSLSFVNSSAHVVTFINTKNAIVDGFRLYNGNSHNLKNTYSVAAGGAVLVNNRTIDKDKRHDMTGNQLRNCVIANCAAPKGSAVYVNGEWEKGDGTLTRAELKIVNTVIRNTTSDSIVYTGEPDYDMLFRESHGVITANGNAYIDVNHATIVNNVGHALKTDNKATEDDAELTYMGRIDVNNTAIFANSFHPLSDRANIKVPMSINGVRKMQADSTYIINNDNIKGDYNLLDAASMGTPSGFGDHCKSNLTLNRQNETNYPIFVNPSRNVGHSFDDDKPLYGGTVSYMPLNTNPMVNAASPESMQGKDRSDVLYRTYGGAADIGAIENTNLPQMGAVIYVTPEGAGKRDGSSWANAIAGNHIYSMYGSPAAGTDALDPQNNVRIINTVDAAIGSGADNGVPTTDPRYQDGFAYKYVGTARYSQSKTLTTITNVTEKTIYKEKDNSERIEETHSSDTVVTKSTSNVDEYATRKFIPDENYPYGEISGQSRSLWRATENYSPVNDDNKWDANVKTKDFNTLVAIDSIRIKNDRKENYVSGLQWAVEEASRRNHASTRIAGESYSEPVQVWVGAGKYTDYKGYIMRDSVSVLGGFPVDKYSTPGMSERVPLMADSSTVMIPKSVQYQSYISKDYETILQISDVSPQNADHTFNTAAIRFFDEEYAYTATRQLETQIVNEREIIHTLTYSDTPTGDVTAMYIQYPDMILSGGSTSTLGDSTYRTLGTATGSLDCWHLVYPTGSNIVGVSELQAKNDYKIYKVTYPLEKRETTLEASQAQSGKWIFIRDGSLTGMRFYQTINYLPAGKYSLTVDLGGGYRGEGGDNWKVDSTNMFFHVYGPGGVELITPQEIFTTGRSRAKRYTCDFTHSGGSVRLEINVGPGKRAEDPILPSLTPAMSSNPNRREVWMSNLKLSHYAEEAGYTVENEEKITKGAEKTISKVDSDFGTLIKLKDRTTLRKRVLAMPDICMPTYFGGVGNPAEGEANSHTVRTKGLGKDFKSRSNNGYIEDKYYREYDAVEWDGFTIRHGFMRNASSSHGGGGGVCMFENSHLKNCIITDNIATAKRQKGGGIFCEGTNAIIENCFILNNTTHTGTQGDEHNQLFAGGLFMYEGTCFNSLIANNYCYGFGGLGLCVGKFYNNTVAYNTGVFSNSNSGNKTVGGVRMAINAGNELFMANCIIYGNSGLAVDITDGSAPASPFIHCYIQSEAEITKTNFVSALGNADEGVENAYGWQNKVLNKVSPSADNTPFEADVDKDGTYTAGAKANNNFALRQVENINCVNTGTDDFFTAVEHAVVAYQNSDKYNANLAKQFRDAVINKDGTPVQLPPTDVVFADRVQDCQVDIGAYEYDGSFSILPDTTTYLPQTDASGNVTDPGRAIFYVKQEGGGGLASGDSPENAACETKFQKILDAAGRYRYNQATLEYYKDKTSNTFGDIHSRPVEVWIAGSDAPYRPQRTTVTQGNVEDNLLEHSLIIPHGIQVRGGYANDFYQLDDDGNRKTEEVTTGVTRPIEDRDILGTPTRLSGAVTSTTGTAGNVYHVLAFTNTLFDAKTEKPIVYAGQDETIDNQKLSVLNDVTKSQGFLHISPEFNLNRTILDGLFIQDGYANGPDQVSRRGGAAVLPEYAHIRNCVMINNKAQNNGGAFYMQPGALVSGSIFRQNEADMGGGVYIEQPADNVTTSFDTYGFIFTSTFVNNHASTRGGGLWFQTNARVTSSAFWHNTSNDYNNVAGQFTNSDNNLLPQFSPLSYSAIEVRKAEGMNNLLLSPEETKGVRWDHQDAYETASEIYYYPLEMSSTLARAGMTYSFYRQLREGYFPTLELEDLAGVKRMQETVEHKYNRYDLIEKNNDFIEIGARAINKDYEVNPDMKYVLRRLYVLDTNDMDAALARRLQDNENTDPLSETYRQMGSSFANPFHRLDDALDYVVKVRKNATSGNEKYKDTRFEIFVSSGTYSPIHDAHGQQAAARTNTFMIPEEVSVFGGMSPDETTWYCQAGWQHWDGTDAAGNAITEAPDRIPIKIGGSDIGTVELPFAYTDTMLSRRQMTDVNLNGVVEPWEFAKQTELSGSAFSTDENSYIYHVITCITNTQKVGQLPTHYSDAACQSPIDREAQGESLESETRRTILLDGLRIVDGHANDITATDYIDPLYADYNKRTYFRGGGIFVDGNWDDDVDEADIPNVTDPSPHDIPLLVKNCQFQNNMAGNGGAIYSNGSLRVYQSTFFQNYSRGPDKPIDQELIPWTAGGCIATNAYCGVANVIFANNSALRGKLPILPNVKNPSENIVDAEPRQGIAGVISAASNSTVHALNCDFVKNEAVAYPAIFNFQTNDVYGMTAEEMAACEDETCRELGSLEKYYAVNCIFWGNHATGLDGFSSDYTIADETKETFNKKYNAYKNDCMQYPQDLRRTLSEKIENNETLTDDEIKQINHIEGLYFCAYEDGLGLGYVHPDPTVDTNNYQETLIVTSGEDRNEETIFKELYTELGNANHNIRLSSVNTATDGPNFVKPSTDPGKDNYVPDADWLFARINSLTDAGWSYLEQNVTRETVGYEDYDGNPFYVGTSYPTAADAEAAAIASTKANHDLTGDVSYAFPIYEAEAAGFKRASDDYIGGGIYKYYADNLDKRYRRIIMPYGDQRYMTYFNNSERQNMQRISSEPKIGVEKVYIDIGVYEYQYVKIKLDETMQVDTIWVAESPGPHGYGLTPDDPTTDIQEAIDRLLKSRNNHDKYVCIFKGEYTPTIFDNNRLAFTISIPTDANVYLPRGAKADVRYSVRSLNFIGGYNPNDVTGHLRDDTTVLRMPLYSNETAREHLVLVQDMENRYTMRNYLGERQYGTDTIVPISFEGITFVNAYAPYVDAGTDAGREGGAAIYYSRQVKDDDVTNPKSKTALPLESFSQSKIKEGDHYKADPVDPWAEVPKLTIKNCRFVASATEMTQERQPSAVKIQYGGGKALIVNSLFHSNAGAPLEAPVTDNTFENETQKLDTHDNPVTVVNCTFALNGGHTTLGDDNSQIHNSIFWNEDWDDNLDKPKADQKHYKLGNEDGKDIVDKDLFTYNAVLNYADKAYEAEENNIDEQHNIAIFDKNDNVINGPNFYDINLSAATLEQKEQRDFRVNPARRILSGASADKYKELVPFRIRTILTKVDSLVPMIDDTLKNVHDMEMAPEPDLAINNKVPRWLGEGIERGAYECAAVIQRVLYVDPSQPEYEDFRDGTSWEKAYGQSKLQNAVYVASIYAQTHPGKQAFVYVKAHDNYADTDDRLTITDHVTIVGGVKPTDFLLEARKDLDNVDYSDAEVTRYLNQVHAIGQNTIMNQSSFIHGIKPDEEMEGNCHFLLDGFVVAPSLNTKADVSPVKITNGGVALKNIVVRDFRQTAEPVIDMTSGLLYNTLVYNNETADGTPVLRVGNRALVLNVTAVSDKAGQQVIDASTAGTASVLNTITRGVNAEGDFALMRQDNASSDAFLSCYDKPMQFAPYFSNNNAYTDLLPDELTNKQYMQYQLHEQSAALNHGKHIKWWYSEAADNSGVNTLFEDYQDFVNFSLDRDLLGNPRLLGSAVDLGAFETWYVQPKSTLYASNLTNAVLDFDTDDAEKKQNAYTLNYGGHMYPHTGSVAYIDTLANLVLDTDAPSHTPTGNAIFLSDNGTALSPSYLLVRHGGSLYGNGNDVQLRYLAAEKQLTAQQYSFMALPYEYLYRNATVVDYDEVTDQITPSNAQSLFSAYTYNGKKRAVYRYHFSDIDSGCWEEMDKANDAVAANDGWLMQLQTTLGEKDTLHLRFTAWTDKENTYRYTESEEENFKTVTLTQYDNRTAGTNGSELDFTRLEDMGWNMKGQPWLVAQYLTAALNPETQPYDYQMTLPRVFYHIDGLGQYLHQTIDPSAEKTWAYTHRLNDSKEKVWSSRSWDSDANMRLGAAFFTQTATLTTDDKEAVRFHRPLFDAPKPKPMPRVLFSNRQGEGDIITAYPQADADKAIKYSFGSDALKWQSKAETAMSIEAANAMQLSILAAAPVEVDIPLTITVSADNDEQTPFTFSLPEPEAFDGYQQVWLIDRQLSRTIDLKTADYTVTLKQGTYRNRFFLRFGGFPLGDDKREYIVYSYQRQLFVRGLMPGDQIWVYGINGMLIEHHQQTEGAEWQTTLPDAGIFTIRVNNTATNVRSH